MTDLGARLALEDDAYATTAHSTTAAVQVRVLVYRAIDVVFVALVIIFSVVRTGDGGRGSCSATPVERGDERWRLSPKDDDQNSMQAFHEATIQQLGRVERLGAGKLWWVVSRKSSGDADAA